MTNGAHGNAVVNLKKFLPSLTEGEKKDAIAIAKRHDRTARGELHFDVLAAVGDRFNPTIRLFDHATVSLKTQAILLSAKALKPSPDTLLLIAEILPRT